VLPFVPFVVKRKNMSQLIFKSKRIFYSTTGAGPALVLLHGFTESSKIWTKFARSLSRDFRVITIDLPGHGKSDMVASIHTMELVADIVHEVLKAEKVRTCVMAGHSMGGYVTQAFARMYPAMLKGICIFHSHCFADSEEDKKNRDRTIALVRKDKFSFLTQFVRSLFPEGTQTKYKKEIDILISDAETMSKEAVIAAIEGMKRRKDQTDFLKKIKVPVLFIIGLKDSKAPVARLWEMVSLPPKAEVLLFRDGGHMGFIEAPETTREALRHFALKS
jgi:pimeloyl-ACP methyl ester carboxylesterase